LISRSIRADGRGTFPAMSRFVLVMMFAVGALGACHKDPDLEPHHPKAGEAPPLPPSTGTVIGYLIDGQAQLNLSADQLTKLKELDASLAAQNESIDTQIRAIERPEDQEPVEKGEKPKPINHAPGKDIKVTPDSQKLHAAHAANDKDALKHVFAVLDLKQVEIAKKILVDRGVELPGEKKPARDDKDGTPLPGIGSGEP
jgi:hypothetical protein